MRTLTPITLWLIAVATAISPQALTRYEAHRLSMACVYAIAAYGDPSGDVPAVLERALDEVDRIDRLMSHYKADSPLSRLNRTAADSAVVVDPELFELIVRSLDYSRDSGGAFDVTVGPLMKAWGFFEGDGRVPAKSDLAAARRHVGAGHVMLDAAAKTI